MANYCARFINGKSDLNAPLRDLGKKSDAAVWQVAGVREVIQMLGKALTPTKQRYSQIYREMLAIGCGYRKFGFYLRGCEFTIWAVHSHSYSFPTIKKT